MTSLPLTFCIPSVICFFLWEFDFIWFMRAEITDLSALYYKLPFYIRRVNSKNNFHGNRCGILSIVLTFGYQSISGTHSGHFLLYVLRLHISWYSLLVKFLYEQLVSQRKEHHRNRVRASSPPGICSWRYSVFNFQSQKVKFSFFYRSDDTEQYHDDFPQKKVLFKHYKHPEFVSRLSFFLHHPPDPESNLPH